MSERLERVNEIIERTFRGEADAEEIQRLTQWRHDSLANERHYRKLVRLLDTARALVPSVPDDTAHARASSIIAERSSVGHRDAARAGGMQTSVRRWAPWSVAAAMVLVAVSAWLTRVRAPDPAWGATDVSTGRSEMATVQLPDGSVVRLAPASRVTFGSATGRREVTLDGRAFFAVARSPGRPFVVRTRLGEATVLGTRFELSTEENDLRLVVVEGRVSLAGQTNRVEVRGGETSGIRHGTAMPPTPVPDADALEQWVGKFLVFHDTPMSQVARDIEHMYGVRVILGDSAVAARTVSGTFTDRSAEQVIAVVCTIVGARCVVEAGKTTIWSQ